MAIDEVALALERGFLAREFLTWLWFRCEVEGGEFQVGQTELAMVVEDALALATLEPDGTKVTIRGGTPTERPEAANALGTGLLLRKARLLLAQGELEWTFTLDGETLDVTSVKVPEAPEGSAEEESEEEDPLVAKLEAGEQLREWTDALFRQFLELRLADDWDRIEVPRLSGWLRMKLDRAWETVGAA